MSAAEKNEGPSHALAAEHPLAVCEWLASRVLSLIDDAREVCRLALVNKTFYNASVSDSLWEKRLPQLDHLSSIFSNAILQQRLHLSKRDLHSKLCSSVLYDDGRKRFWIDPASGGGCYMISARALSICWATTLAYRSSKPWPGAMFQEVAYLERACWSDISGVFCQVLKPGNYLVSFRMQLWSSWGNYPVKLSLEVTASAYPPYLSEVVPDRKTNFKRRKCIPFLQILEPENVAHVTNVGDQLDHGQDGIKIDEEETDGNGSDDGHDGELSLEGIASAYPPHLVEVFINGRSNFTPKERMPFIWILDRENVGHVTNDGGQLEPGHDGIDIGEEGYDWDDNDDGHHVSANGIKCSDDYDICDNYDYGGADGSVDNDNHDNKDHNKCEDDDDEDSNEHDDDYDENLLYPLLPPRYIEQHNHNDDSCGNDDDGGADGSCDCDYHGNDSDNKCEDDDDEDSNHDDNGYDLLFPFLQHKLNENADINEWLEYDIGEFSVQDHNEEQPIEIKFRMEEINYRFWKPGFVLDGVIIRPVVVAEMAELV
ncbi:hypothetical protein KP509_16G068800 [Ceratopteris richardii]|uniref:Uncharacterized protein n=1 Tax=Ceratopteris richardii TaxID=49495 RepID=A0A8T2T3U8_CERRI|nr:hypothetical protein KP509_16G068800 [Ceratopteris richardii]